MSHYAIQAKVASGGFTRLLQRYAPRFSSTLLTFCRHAFECSQRCYYTLLLSPSLHASVNRRRVNHILHCVDCVCAAPSPIRVPLTGALGFISDGFSIPLKSLPYFPKLTHPMSQAAQAFNYSGGSNSSKRSRTLF